eukprot:jgi/Mesvir1/12453/Mv00607-RA.1
MKKIPAAELENAHEVLGTPEKHGSLVTGSQAREDDMSTAGSVEELSKTRKLAVDWLKKWDWDNDGIISSLEMKGAAMEHVKLQTDDKKRGVWMVILIILIVCCGGVILGVRIWANAISKDSEAETGEDLGGFTMPKKDGSAVVFKDSSFLVCMPAQHVRLRLPRWLGTANVTFFSPRGERLSISRRPSPSNMTMTFHWIEHSAAAPSVIYDSNYEPDLLFLYLTQGAIGFLRQQGAPLTVPNVVSASRVWVA